MKTPRRSNLHLGPIAVAMVLLMLGADFAAAAGGRSRTSRQRDKQAEQQKEPQDQDSQEESTSKKKGGLFGGLFRRSERSTAAEKEKTKGKAEDKAGSAKTDPRAEKTEQTKGKKGEPEKQADAKPEKAGLFRVLTRSKERTLEEKVGGGDASKEADEAREKNPGLALTRADKFVVTQNKTPFYEEGPLQARGVDQELKRGEIVSVVKWRKGWCDVELASGAQGTIATDLLRKAKASDFPVPPSLAKYLKGDASYVSSGATDGVPVIPVAPPPLPDFSESEEGSTLGPEVNPLLLPVIDE